MPNYAKFDQFTMTLPEEGPKCVPDSIDFTANERVEIDLSQLIDNGWLDYISGVYIDNTANDGYITFECGGSNQRFTFPATYSGYVPLFLPNPPKVHITSTENATVKFQWYNVPVFPLLIPGPNTASASDVDIIAVGGDPYALGSAVMAASMPVTIATDDTVIGATNSASPATDTATAPLNGRLQRIAQRLTSLIALFPASIGAKTGAGSLSVVAATDGFQIAQAIGGIYTDRSIANLSGASQQLMAANANRRVLIIQNVAANAMAVNLTGGAAALNTAGSINIPVGGSITLDNYPSTSIINIIGTANDDVTAYEG